MADDHGAVGALRQTERTMRIIQNSENPRLRIAFGSVQAAEAFIATTATPQAWIIEPGGSTVADPRSP